MGLSSWEVCLRSLVLECVDNNDRVQSTRCLVAGGEDLSEGVREAAGLGGPYTTTDNEGLWPGPDHISEVSKVSQCHDWILIEGDQAH